MKRVRNLVKCDHIYSMLAAYDMFGHGKWWWELALMWFLLLHWDPLLKLGPNLSISAAGLAKLSVYAAMGSQLSKG